MGDTTLSSLAAALEQRFRARLARQQNRAAVTLDLLQKRVGKGKNCAWDVAVGTTVGTYYDDGEDVSVFNDDTELPATLNWAEVGDAFAMTGRAEDAAAGDGTELANVWMTKLGYAVNRTAAKLNVELIGGLGTAAPQKIFGLLASGGPLGATGTYAGIDRAVQTQWQGNELANGGVGRPVTVDLIEQGNEAVWIDTSEAVDYYVTTTPLWRSLAAKLAPDRRYMQSVVIRGQKIVLDGGFDALEYNGKPIFKDKDLTAGTLVGLNVDYVGIESLPCAPTRMARGEVLAMIPIVGTAYEMPSPIPGTGFLQAAISKLARAGNKSKFQVLTTCQLWCDRPSAHFVLRDLIA